jgi:5-(carboxyamino)imidazole ribonucleotide synthase
MNLNTKIGVLGGGQLGRMLVEASIPMCLDISILDESIEYPAAGICTRFYEGKFSDYDDVMNFGLAMDVVTVEIESVNTDALRRLEMQGKKVYPQPSILNIINDKGLQKKFYQENNIPTSTFQYVESKQEVIEKIQSGSIQFPFVMKLRKGGYDGRGVSVINNEADFDLIFDAPSIIEKKVAIKKELAVIAARSTTSEVKLFPITEMVFHPVANLVEYLFSPANINSDIVEQINDIAIALVNRLGIVGLLAVELFLDENNNVLVNEIAPRPHNSGHHTIEANITSQFEQHLRAILGLPLGNTDAIMPSAMVNLLGEDGYSGEAYYEGIEKLLSMDEAYLHLYNKKITKPNRKMGHITIMKKTFEKLHDSIQRVKSTIKVISKK